VLSQVPGDQGDDLLLGEAIGLGKPDEGVLDVAAADRRPFALVADRRPAW
jgi:hypothetical protein